MQNSPRIWMAAAVMLMFSGTTFAAPVYLNVSNISVAVGYPLHEPRVPQGG